MRRKNDTEGFRISQRSFSGAYLQTPFHRFCLLRISELRLGKYCHCLIINITSSNCSVWCLHTLYKFTFGRRVIEYLLPLRRGSAMEWDRVTGDTSLTPPSFPLKRSPLSVMNGLRNLSEVAKLVRIFALSWLPGCLPVGFCIH